MIKNTHNMRKLAFYILSVVLLHPVHAAFLNWTITMNQQKHCKEK